MDQNVKIFYTRQSYIGCRSAELVSFVTSTFLVMSTLHGIDVLHCEINYACQWSIRLYKVTQINSNI